MDKTRLCMVFGLVVFVCLIVNSFGIPVKDEKFLEKVAGCKELCGHCDCLGFYCGDECICECSDQSDEELNCVDKMQDKCKKLKLPFEVLIQGTQKNRLVRSLMYADPNIEVCPKEQVRNERNTITIYKPENNRVQKREIHRDTVESDDTNADDVNGLEESHSSVPGSKAENETTLKELEAFLGQLGIRLEASDTGLMLDNQHDKREILDKVAAKEHIHKALADEAVSLQLPADSAVHKREADDNVALAAPDFVALPTLLTNLDVAAKIEQARLKAAALLAKHSADVNIQIGKAVAGSTALLKPIQLNALGIAPQFNLPELLIANEKALLVGEKAKIWLDELAAKAKLSGSAVQINLADLGIKKLALADLGLKNVEIADLAEKLTLANLGKNFALVDLNNLGLNNQLMLNNLALSKLLGSSFVQPILGAPAPDIVAEAAPDDVAEAGPDDVAEAGPEADD